MAFPLPDKPSVAVLPFDNLSGDPEQEHFSDGLAENIITQLSQIHNLFVIARNSSFTYKGKNVKVHQVAEELGVRYVVEGSIQQQSDRIRVTARIIDATTGRHLWADRYDRQLKDFFAIQDEITQNIVRETAVTLGEGENERVYGYGTKNVEAWILYRKALKEFRKFTKESMRKARQLTEKVIELDPNYPTAYAFLGWTYAVPVRFGYSKSPVEDLEKAEELVEKALALDHDHAEAQNQVGYIYMLRGDYDRAIKEGKQAVELAPNMPDSHAILSLSLIFAGQYEGAITGFKQAMRLAPSYSWWYVLRLGEAYFCAGLYEKALPAFDETVKLVPRRPRVLVFKAATYQALGRSEEAKAVVEEVLRIKPTYSLEQWRKVELLENFKDQSAVDRMLSYARKAGLPETPPLPLPDKPSIAVLPFVNMSGDPEQKYISDGITEELITALSKTPKLYVIAGDSDFIHEGKPVKVQQVGRELGVNYVLKGSVRKAGNKIRATAQLVDAKTGHLLWGERYDRELREIFVVQDQITMQIITALEVELTEGETARMFARGTNSLEAYLNFLQAREHWRSFTTEGNISARRFLEKAIALDPEYPSPYSWLGATHMMDVYFQATKSPEQSMNRAVQLAQKAIALDDSLADAHALLGLLYALSRKYEKGIGEAKLAIALNPNGVTSNAYLSVTLRLLGKYEEAVQIAQKAIRLNPFPFGSLYRTLGWAYICTGSYEEAISAFKKALRLTPDDIFAHLPLTIAYSLSGREEEARAEAAKVLKLNRKFSVERYAKTVQYKNKADTERFFAALRKAGLPD
jgi:adenylate cyclase